MSFSNRIVFSLFLIVILIFVFSLSVFPATVFEDDGSVLLPAQKSIYPLNSSKQLKLTLSPEWQRFTQQYGDWSVLWNENSGTPHRAFGPAIKIPGYSFITSSNVRDAAISFINSERELLRINPAELKFVRATEVNNRWYVSYVQQKDDIDVLFSEVELRIFGNGNLMAFGSDFYPEIDVSTTPSLSYEDAKIKALDGLDVNSNDYNLAGEGRLYILPEKEKSQTTYHLVYRVLVKLVEPSENYVTGNYITYVDAHSGEIVWRHNLVRTAEAKGKVQGEIQPETPFDPFEARDFPFQWVTVGGQQLVTDSLGLFLKDITSTENVSTQLSGPFLNVNRQDGPDASISTTISPGDSINILWDASNAHPAERDAFFHGNIVHNYIVTQDPNFTFINYSMPCAVNINDACNAFYDGNGINFFLAGGGCPNTGQMPSVVYHEYGHAVNDKLYLQLGSPNGMINGATHEGMADVLSGMIEDDNRIGRGFFGPNTFLRNLDNNARYPDDISGEPHNDGEVIGGAFWSLRQASDLETARHLSYFAMYGLPDDPNTGIAFSEWFVEVLVADDDDGNLSNGTPHSNAIVSAFNAHGMGTGLFMSFSFNHTPVADTQDTLNAYSVNFHLEGVGLAGSDPDSVKIVYSTDGFQTETTILPTEVSPGDFQGEIPAQPAGTIVEYYISAFDPLGNNTLRFPGNNAYGFLVGFNSIVLDEMETDSGWIIGAPDDNATTGIWERANPRATSVGSQPENDHTVNGLYCFVTDGRNQPGNAGAYDVDNGKTTLFSPVYHIQGLQEPILRYYKWYSNDRGAAPGQDFWKVDVTDNGGITWKPIENTNVSTIGWEKFQVKLSTILSSMDSIQFRFIASDFGAGSLVEGLVDDFEILAKGNVTSVDNENKISTLPTEFSLDQNYPNPFNPTTTIKYGVPQSTNVVLKIYNTLGEEIRTLVNTFQSAGYKSVEWDGKNNAGKSVSSGVYIYRLSAGDEVQSRKMLLVR